VTKTGKRRRSAIDGEQQAPYILTVAYIKTFGLFLRPIAINGLQGP
jgi:hypothetical protein